MAHRELFEQPDREPIIPLDQAKEYAGDTAKAASAIKAMKGSAGWSIFLEVMRRRKDTIIAKNDYTTIEAFRADRLALDIVEDAIGELDDLVEDAATAAELFDNLAGAESQTPRSTVELSTGSGTVEA